MIKTVTLLLLLVASAHADERYKIHPTSGWFAQTAKPCGEETRTQINELVSAVPTLIVDRTTEGVQMQIVRAGKTTLVSNETLAPTSTDPGTYAWFRWGTKRMVIKVMPATKTSPDRYVTLSLIRTLDAIECTEKWAGKAEK